MVEAYVVLVACVARHMHVYVLAPKKIAEHARTCRARVHECLSCKRSHFVPGTVLFNTPPTRHPYRIVSTMSSEKDALLPSNASGSGPSYYFLKSDTSHHEARDMDGGEVIEQLPAGATEDDFASRAVGTPRAVSAISSIVP